MQVVKPNHWVILKMNKNYFILGLLLILSIGIVSATDSLYSEVPYGITRSATGSSIPNMLGLVVDINCNTSNCDSSNHIWIKNIYFVPGTTATTAYLFDSTGTNQLKNVSIIDNTAIMNYDLGTVSDVNNTQFRISFNTPGATHLQIYSSPGYTLTNSISTNPSRCYSSGYDINCDGTDTVAIDNILSYELFVTNNTNANRSVNFPLGVIFDQNTGGQVIGFGEWFVINNDINYTFKGVTKYTEEASSRAILREWPTSDVVGTPVNFDGNYADFSSQNIILDPSKKYAIELDSNGVSRYIFYTLSASFPINKYEINWTSGYFEGQTNNEVTGQYLGGIQSISLEQYIEPPSCVEDWINVTQVCNGIINESIIEYVDNNSCGTTISLPLDNGTIISCPTLSAPQMLMPECGSVYNFYLYYGTRYIDFNPYFSWNRSISSNNANITYEFLLYANFNEVQFVDESFTNNNYTLDTQEFDDSWTGANGNYWYWTVIATDTNGFNRTINSLDTNCTFTFEYLRHSPGISFSDSITIDDENTTYSLENDLINNEEAYYPYVMTSNTSIKNITIDCNDFTVSGMDRAFIFNNPIDTLEIRNCKFDNVTYMFYSDTSDIKNVYLHNIYANNTGMNILAGHDNISNIIFENITIENSDISTDDYWMTVYSQSECNNITFKNINFLGTMLYSLFEFDTSCNGIILDGIRIENNNLLRNLFSSVNQFVTIKNSFIGNNSPFNIDSYQDNVDILFTNNTILSPWTYGAYGTGTISVDTSSTKNTGYFPLLNSSNMSTLIYYEGTCSTYNDLICITGPTITSYYPLNKNPIISNRMSQYFNVTTSQNNTYQWYINGTSQSHNTSSFSVNGTVIGLGSYNVSVKVFDNQSNTTLSWILGVSSNIVPIINSITPSNSTPSIYTVQNLVMSVSACDSDYGDSISYEWYLNGASLNRNLATYTANGNSLGVGIHNATIIISDLFNHSVSQTWMINVSIRPNVAPVINSYSPSTNSQIIYNHNQTFSVSVTDIDSDTLSYEWFINGTNQNITTNHMSLNWTEIGSYLISMNVSDGHNHSVVQNWNLEVTDIPNYAPTIDSYSPINLNPGITVEQYQNFSIIASDIENDNLSYEWFVNNYSQSINSSTFRINGSDWSIGFYNIIVKVSESNTSYTTQSWNLRVVAAGPVIQTVDLQPSIIISSSHIVGSCVASGDSILNVSYSFYRNNILYQSGNRMMSSGSLLSANLAATLIPGNVWEFRCNAKDNLSRTSGWYNSSQRIVQFNSAPTISASLGTPLYDIGGSLPVYCSVADSNSDNTSLQVRVYRQGLLYYQNSTTYSTTPRNQLMVTLINTSDFIAGEEWYASCRAYDGTNYSSWTDSTPTIVLKNNIAPVITYVRLYPRIMFNYSMLYATALATDVNRDNITYNYTLYDNGVIVENKFGSTSVNFTYNTTVGRDMSVQVSAFDGELSTKLNSTIITVRDINNAPYVQNTRIIPDSILNKNDNVYGYCTGIDVDGDSLSYNYVWYSNDVPIKSGSKIYSDYNGFSQGNEVLVDILSSSQTIEGELLKFSCQPNDSVDVGNYTNSTGVLVYGFLNNTLGVSFNPPEIKYAAISPISGDTYENFNLSAKIKDKDNTSIVRVEWRIVKNGEYQTSQLTPYYNLTNNVELVIPLGTILAADTSSQDTFYVRARAYDGTDYSGWTSSNAITISNTIPLMSSSSILTNKENESLISECVAIDPDANQHITFDKVWYKNGSEVSTLDSIPTTMTSAGENWTVSCRAFDGVNYSSRMNSSSIIILDTNNAPELTSIKINGISNTIIGRCLVNDVQGEIVNYTAMFYKNLTLQNTQSINAMSGIEQMFNYTLNLTPGDDLMFYCQGTNIDGSVNNTKSLSIPSVSFSHSESTTIQKIAITWITNADTVVIYLNGTYLTNTTLSRYTIEGLTPDTDYNITLQPIKNGFYSTPIQFISRTQYSDNNKPTISNVTISPSLAYTDSVLQGYCNGTDIESMSLFYTYRWYVNGVLVDNGVSTLKSINELNLIDNLPSSNINANDTVRFSCIANDGIGSSNETFSQNLTILNTPQVISNAFISINNTYYLCSYDFFDLDVDNQTNVSYTWFKNGINMNQTTSSISAIGIISPDSLVCQINSSTNYHNVVQNTSIFTIGDFEAPAISNIVLPKSVYTDTAVFISADCSDNIGVANGYPKISFINPNLLEGEYPLFYSNGISFSRYLIFSTVGEYTDVEFSCKDGNGNNKVVKFNGTVYAKDRETTIETGGPVAGGSGGEGNVTVFKLKPSKQTYDLSLGQTKIIEFEVSNELSQDVSFTSAILVDGNNHQSYDWMTFEGGLKAVTFDVESKGSLSAGSKYIRYYITVPSDATLGQYKGIIEVNGKDQTEQYIVNINVVEGTQSQLLSFLNFELFQIPFTQNSITGAAVSESTAVNGKPFKVWMLLIAISVIIGLVLFFNRKK